MSFAAGPKKPPVAKKVQSVVPAPQPPKGPQLRVLDRAENFIADYQAEVYSGVPLSDPYAKERGLERGLVWIAFTDERQLSFRVPKEKMKRLTRLVMDDEPKSPPGFALAASRSLYPAAFTSPADTRSYPKDRVDVIDTSDGTIIVATTTSNAGIFTSSDVYLFPKNKNESELLRAAHISDVAREHLRAALTLARAQK
jgi:hypothetical protein